MKKTLIDWDEAARHLNTLDPVARGHILLATDDQGDRRVAHLVGSLARHSARLQHLQRDGYGIHVTVNAMAGNRRRAADVTKIRAVWAELDGPARRPWPLMPSLRIRTSPGRGHCYWLVDPEDPLKPDEAAVMLRTIAARYGADRAAVDLARTLRLGGSWHQKQEPQLVRIIGGTGQRFTRGELVEAFPTPLPLPRPLVPIDREDRYINAAVRAIVADLSQAAEGTRNAVLNKASFRLGQLGCGLNEVAKILSPPALAIGLSAPEIKRTVRSGVTAGETNPRVMRGVR